MRIASNEFHVQRGGTGASFLWAHGLFSSIAIENAWGLFDWAFLSGHFDFVRYDARGHGRSEGTLVPEDYRWSSLADDFLAIASAHGLERFVGGGVSMGCATCLFAALHAPELLRALVLTLPPTAWEARVAQSGMYDQLANLVESKGVAPVVEMLRQKPILPAFVLRENPGMNESFLQGLGEMERKAVIAILRGAKLCQFPSREELRKITQPTLILAWPEDSGHPLSVAEELHSLLPESRLVVARSFAEAKDWTRQVHDFLTDIPAS